MGLYLWGTICIQTIYICEVLSYPDSLFVNSLFQVINTNRAEGRGALQYIPANADPFTVLFSHVVESWKSTNTRNLFFDCQKLAS